MECAWTDLRFPSARIAPPAGPSTGGQSITLYGSNFGSSGTSVTIGGSAATNVTVHTPNILTATTGPRSAGTIDVVVTNSDIQSGRLVGGYAYLTCAYTLTPSGMSFNAYALNSGGFGVTATDGCGWSATSNAPWITTSSIGLGDGAVLFSAAANESVASRTGTISVEDQTFTVTQEGAVAANLLATATSPTSVSIAWTASSVDHFELWRDSGSGFALLASPTTTSHTDSSAVPGTTYMYRVRPVDSGGASGAYSNDDLATTIGFTDDPLVSGSTIIKAIHVNELRQAVNAVRAAAGLEPAVFSDSSLPGILVRQLHMIELREALDPARLLLGLPGGSYSALSTGDLIKEVPVHEVRNAVK